MRNAGRWLAYVAALSATLVFPAHGQVRALVLDNVRVIDGTGAAPIGHGRIVIQGDRIAQVGTTLPLPPDAEILDLSGRTLVPGLIDLHFIAIPVTPDVASSSLVDPAIDVYI